MTLISGLVKLPDGTAYPDASFTFTRAPLAVTAQSGAVIVPRSITISTDNAGIASFELLAGPYEAVETVTLRPFAITVPDVAECSFDDCLASSWVPPWPEAVQAAIEARNAAQIAADAADASAVLADADAVATAADRVQTGLDRSATAADRVQTGLDAAAAATSATGAAVSKTAADADAVATAADRVQTGLDRSAVAADRTVTTADRVQTGLDASATAISAAAASLAKTNAEAARDAAQVGANVYTSIAAGLAAVADGAQFMVALSGADYVSRYRRDTSSTYTLLAQYPTVARIDGALPPDFLRPDALMYFIDGAGKSFGSVGLDAAWDVMLKSMRTVDGITMTAYDRVGQGNDQLMLTDAAGKVIWQSAAATTSDGATVTRFDRVGSDDTEGIVVDASGMVVLRSSSVVASDVSGEVINARGSRPNLTARISQALSAYGTPLVPSFGAETLRAQHYLLTKLAYAEAAQVNIAFIGDSYTHNYLRYTGPVTDLLVAKYGDGGGGWTGYGFATAGTRPYVAGGAQPALVNGNPRPAIYGLTFVGQWTCTYNASDSPDLSHIVSVTAGDRITRTVPASPAPTALRVLFIGTADGIVRYRVNGGSWANVNVQGAVGAVQSFDIALSGAATVDIETVSGTVWLCGDNALSSASGIRVHKLGGTGSQISQWAGRTAAQQQAGWALLAVDAFWIMDGTNSQTAGMAAGTWGGYLTTMVGRFRASVAVPDIAVMMPPENQRGLTPAMSDYAAQGREVAALLGTAFIDLQRGFGLAPADYASTSARPLFNADGIHPEPSTGGRVIAAAVLDLITPY